MSNKNKYDTFKPKLSDIFICDKYLHNIREDISELVEDTYMCLDIAEGDMYKLISLIDTYTCDQNMYNLFINSDELKHLEKSVNLVLNDSEIKNTIRLYQIIKDQRDRIVKGYKDEYNSECGDTDVDVNSERVKNLLNEMKMNGILDVFGSCNDRVIDRMNEAAFKIKSLNKSNTIEPQPSETTSPDSEEDDDYDEYWDDTSENYDEYYEYKEYNEDEDDYYDEYDDISEDNQELTDLSDFKIILDSINNMDCNPIKISIDGELSTSDYAYGIPIKNIHLEYYRIIVEKIFDMCVKIFSTYTEFRNDVHENLRYKLSADELADFDKGLQYFMTNDPRLNECGNETVQSALNYVTKLTYVRDDYDTYQSNIKFIEGCIKVLSSLQGV